jgi:hypothetical protein
MPDPATLTVVCLGAADDALRALLRDVLTDQGFRVYLAPRWHHAPNLVIAAVRRWDVAGVMAAARDLAGAAPILAILPFSDERLVQLAREGGARAWFAIGMPLASLAAAIGAIFPGAAARRSEASRG